MPELSLLNYNDLVTYRCGFAVEGGIEDQEAGSGPYKGLVVDIGERLIGVRADGMYGQAPLYFVFKSDIIEVRSMSD